MIINLIRAFYQTFIVNFPAFIPIVFSIMIVLMAKLKVFLFRKWVVFEVFSVVLIAGLYYINRQTSWIPPLVSLNQFRYGIYGLSVILTIIAFLSVMRASKQFNNPKTSAIDFLKNSNVDLYLELNKHGGIVECNLEFLSLVGLERKEVLGKKLLPLILDRIDIVSFDGDKFNADVVEALKRKAKAKRTEKNNLQFEIQHRNNEGSLVTHHFYDIPIFVGNRYNGKILVGEQEKSTLLVRAQTALSQLMADVNIVKQQTFALFSLLNEPAFFFDHSAKKYILSEKIRKALNLTDSEFNFDQYLKLMHPDDIDKFVERSAEINSKVITKFTYRLRIGGEYMVFEERSLMLDDENSQVSLIRLVKVKKDPGEPQKKQEEEPSEESAKEPEKPKNPPKTTISETESVKPEEQAAPKSDDLMKELKELEDKIFAKKK